MGGMKSGTGDVWGDDEDGDEQEESVEDEEREVQSESVEQNERERTASTSDAGFPSGSEASSSEDGRQGSGQSERSKRDVGRESERDDEAAATSTDVGDSSDDVESGKPYVVRRMLKDKSVQFERDERLTLFVHDDVKAGEQELEAHAQELFGRDIPVFDIREAVYRAALRNRDDVVDELEEMGYTRK